MVDKKVVVTGAGSGIGRTIAKLLAEEGYSLILLGRTLETLEATAQICMRPEYHFCYSCDVSQPGSVQQALSESAAYSLYGVVANAGIGGENHAGDNDRWDEIIQTNLTGSYYTVRDCLPYLQRDLSEYKKVLYLSSILARLGVPGYSAYCASKAGILGLMRSQAAEFARDKILVNALCPGWVETRMAEEGLEGFAQALNISRDEAHQLAMKDVPLGKMSTPLEIAHYVSFLFSDAQTSITGQTLDINGGAQMP
ncbi:MAG: short-chain dehydrogenase [Nitrospinae bacterium CG11_big_fil_rev_8_21_14_0_20_45_15]|nr:MAG: short-chain dehydrogenase [Nitrospinae bacterium CG11_big_fil_rev_8_21_14_0_20_45_15]